MSFGKRSAAKRMGRRRSRSGRKKLRQKLRERPATNKSSDKWSYDRLISDPLAFVGDVIHESPRKAAVLTVLVAGIFEGFALGLLIGIIVVLIHLPFGGVGFWIYFINAGAGLATKVAWAWIWVMWGQDKAVFVVRHIFQNILKFEHNAGHISNELPSQSSSTVLVVVTVVAVATLLVTAGEQSNVPLLLREPLMTCFISALTGFAVATCERLSMPVIIQALMRNKHDYQDKMSR